MFTLQTLIATCTQDELNQQVREYLSYLCNTTVGLTTMAGAGAIPIFCRGIRWLILKAREGGPPRGYLVSPVTCIVAALSLVPS